MNPIARILIGFIQFYQKNISPRKISCCRFTPSCSAYAIEAIRLHGCVRGLCLAFWRILRCHPLCRGGYDPVPEPRKKRKENI